MLALVSHTIASVMRLFHHNHTQAGHWLKKLVSGKHQLLIQQMVKCIFGMNQQQVGLK